ncbi:MAG TPA: glutamate-5-semialdehyde dehydrogenase [Sumerlaeia bacterium]|nr:glutamate-5-semialdehyde dehydrogenase [Sumerlaeia bacterium]
METQATAEKAKRSAAVLARAPTKEKNATIRAMAERLESRKEDVLEANKEDVSTAESSGLPPNMVERLRFGEASLNARIRSLGEIESLADPVGRAISVDRRPNGLEVARVRAPLGVILMIYEARPHVTVNAGALPLKAGNAVILRGGLEARRTNAMLGALWRESLSEAGLPEDAIQVVSGTHEEMQDLLQYREHIDLVIPRGGKGLIETVSSKSAIPVVKHFEGLCHVFIDEGADIDRALAIAVDSKCLMPEVCNAMETLLVAEPMAEHMQRIVRAFSENAVTVKGCEKVRQRVPTVLEATEKDWRTEYLDNVISIRVVEDIDKAIEHANLHGSHHTDAIVTNNLEHARRFSREVDSAVVLVNASTMFCDGQTLGMGAEIGISTDKLHARGPMGLEELTTYKFVIYGDGQVMGQA